MNETNGGAGRPEDVATEGKHHGWALFVATFLATLALGGLVVGWLYTLSAATEGRPEGRAMSFLVGAAIYVGVQFLAARFLIQHMVRDLYHAEEVKLGLGMASGLLALAVLILGIGSG